MILKILLALILTTFIDANAMLRTLKYSKMKEITNNKICVYNMHQLNKKKMNVGNVTNTTQPIVCKLLITAQVVDKKSGKEVKLIKKGVVNTFELMKLKKTCAVFDTINTKKQKISKMAGFISGCTTQKSAKNVFGKEYTNSKREKISKGKVENDKKL